jgi:hypothetical protein
VRGTVERNVTHERQESIQQQQMRNGASASDCFGKLQRLGRYKKRSRRECSHHLYTHTYLQTAREGHARNSTTCTTCARNVPTTKRCRCVRICCCHRRPSVGMISVVSVLNFRDYPTKIPKRRRVKQNLSRGRIVALCSAAATGIYSHVAVDCLFCVPSTWPFCLDHGCCRDDDDDDDDDGAWLSRSDTRWPPEQRIAVPCPLSPHNDCLVEAKCRGVSKNGTQHNMTLVCVYI